VPCKPVSRQRGREPVTPRLSSYRSVCAAPVAQRPHTAPTPLQLEPYLNVYLFSSHQHSLALTAIHHHSPPPITTHHHSPHHSSAKTRQAPTHHRNPPTHPIQTRTCQKRDTETYGAHTRRQNVDKTHVKDIRHKHYTHNTRRRTHVGVHT
jgi:hypothetical protein